MIEFDVETTGLQPHSQTQWPFLFQFYDGQELVAYPWSPQNRTHDADIQGWFDRAEDEGLRAWNSKFDFHFAEQMGFNLPSESMWHDGMLVAHAINERRSVALKGVARELFGEDAADLQKAVKDFLSSERRRRTKIITDADKARVGSLKIDYVEGKCQNPECKQVVEMKDDSCLFCPTCSDTLTAKNRKRKATDEEVAAALAAAEAITDDEGKMVEPNFSDVPMEIMEPYALEDVILTRKIGDVYDAHLARDPGLNRVYEFERECMAALFAVEKRGLPAKALEYRRLEQEVLDNLDNLKDKVSNLAMEADPVVYARELGVEVEVDETGRIKHYKGGGGRLEEFNPNSTPQILACLKARGADMQYMSEKNGSLSADAENLRAVADELAAAILEFRSEFKVLSTYVRPMIGRSFESSIRAWKEAFIAPDSRIHANYRQVGARTGRMSCSDPNIQNQPRDDLRLRYNICAEPGHVLVACDLTNIEMVLFAAYCGEGRLLNAVRSGEDLHVLTAKMLGLRDRPRPGGGIETARQLGKTYNFSRIYGGGLRTIKRSFRCNMEEARLLKKRFDNAYPEVGRLQTRIEYRLQDDGYIQDRLISGRRFRVDERDAYKAPNYLIQGTAAALLKKALISLHKDGVPVVALIHDEIVAHVPVDEAVEVAALISKRMTQDADEGGALWIPEDVKDGVVIPAHPMVPLKAEADIIQRWSDAKPLKEKVVDSNGNAVLDPETGEQRERLYYFDPKWANVPRRYVDEQEALAA